MCLYPISTQLNQIYHLVKNECIYSFPQLSTYHDEASKSPARFELNVEMVDNFVTSDDDDDGAWSATETISRGASRVWIFKPKPGWVRLSCVNPASWFSQAAGSEFTQPSRSLLFHVCIKILMLFCLYHIMREYWIFELNLLQQNSRNGDGPGQLWGRRLRPRRRPTAPLSLRRQRKIHLSKEHYVGKMWLQLIGINIH